MDMTESGLSVCLVIRWFEDDEVVRLLVAYECALLWLDLKDGIHIVTRWMRRPVTSWKRCMLIKSLDPTNILLAQSICCCPLSLLELTDLFNLILLESPVIFHIHSIEVVDGELTVLLGLINC